MAKGLPRAARAAEQLSSAPPPQVAEHPSHSSSFPADYAARSRSTHSIGRSARPSRLPSIVLPYFRRPSISDSLDMSTQKPPLLSLKLTSLSFLESDVHDDGTRFPVYSIKTTGTSTVIKRSDLPWGGTSHKAATIKWPRMVPSKTKDRQSLGVLVQMKGDHWREGDNFLRHSSMTSGHKFSIPHYCHSLKWKKVGASYWCTAPSCKGPIAILDPHVESVPPRLRIYETLHDKYNDRGLAVHNGVLVHLMDYLLVTALLLVTDIQEWMVVQKYEGGAESSRHGQFQSEDSPPADQTSTSSPRTFNISQSRWRKILNGEPLFPKLNLQRSFSSSTTAPGFSASPTPTSVHQMAKIIHGEPLFPNLRTPTPDSALSLSNYEDDDDDERLSSADYIPSPIASSIYFPPAGAPSHNYFDPTFYDTSDVPPVPPLPAKYASVHRGPGLADNSSTHSSPRSLPTPPKSATSPLPTLDQAWLRPQSTPPEDSPVETRTFMRPSTANGPLPAPRSRTIRSSSMSGTSMISNGGFPRRLPDPPTQTPTPPPSQSPSTRPRALPPQPTTPPHPPVSRRSSAVPRSLPPTPGQSTTDLPLHPRPLRSIGGSSVSLASAYASDVDSTPRVHRRKPQDKDLYETVRRQRPPTIRESVYDRDIPPPAYSSLEFAS